MPIRIRRSRAKGWRLPEGAVIVDRSTPWGNPFVVGRDGLAWECVRYYRLMLTGLFLVPTRATDVSLEAQEVARRQVAEHIDDLRGKNLVCWCRLDEPCHADVLLQLANRPVCEEVSP